MAPVCAWRKDDRWYWGQTPSARLNLSLAELTDLPALMRAQDASLAVGLLPYEAGLALHGLAAAAAPIEVLLFDKTESALNLPACDEDFFLSQAFRPCLEREAYNHAFQRIQAYLTAGDCYQVNFAQAFEARFTGSAYAGWRRLMQQHSAPHACYFAGRDATIMSASPERFLHIDQRQIVTDPIKGSRPRGATTAEDDALAQALLHSSKDLAENLMIVDLLRNDLGAICEPGSVQADPLFELQRFSNVQHLVSRVSGKLTDAVSPMTALLSCFPGGSITGAPKRRAMEIIRELESLPRGAYCGSFFTLDNAGRLDANILIRTFQANTDGRLRIHGGGGITVASDCAAEYAESVFKVERLMQALG